MVKIKRTFTARVRKKCCRNGDIVYNPQDRYFKIHDIKERDDFEYSLVMWKDNVEKQLEKLADNECRRKGTPRLCHFLVYNDKVTEEIVKEPIPKYILDRIDTIREYIEEAESYDEKKAFQDEAVGLLEDYMSKDEARKFVSI